MGGGMLGEINEWIDGWRNIWMNRMQNGQTN